MYIAYRTATFMIIYVYFPCHVDMILAFDEEPLKFVAFASAANIAEVVVGGGGGGSGSGGGGSSGGAGSDYEQGPLKMASVPPGCLEIGPPDSCALQVACGLHHTGT